MKINRSGFTLVEMIMVVAVLAILVTISVVAYNGSQARSRDAKRKVDIANIVKAMELYYSDNGSYPITSGSTANLSTFVSSNDASWAPYETTLKNAKAIDQLPIDPRNYPSTGAVGTSVVNNVSYYSYTIYVSQGNGSWCGKPDGQMYVIVYRLEVMAKERFADGDCTVNALGDTWYAGGNSYYRSSH